MLLNLDKCLLKLYEETATIEHICKEKEEPSLTDDTHLDLVTFEGETLAGFLTLSAPDIWGWITLSCGGCPIIVGCLGAPPASTHQMLVASNLQLW